MPKKTWNEKLQTGKRPKVVVLDAKISSRLKAATMVVPAPPEVDEIMNSVDEGQLISADQIQKKLAEKHGTDTACPLCIGIFTNIAAYAAEENRQNGILKITPYWRTLKTGGKLNEKYPGGIARHKALLESEGYQIVQKGKNYFVEEYQRYLV